MFCSNSGITKSVNMGCITQKSPLSILRGLPLITCAPRGVGGSTLMRSRGEGGMTKNIHFVCRFIENATISETFKD